MTNESNTPTDTPITSDNTPPITDAGAQPAENQPQQSTSGADSADTGSSAPKSEENPPAVDEGNGQPESAASPSAPASPTPISEGLLAKITALAESIGAEVSLAGLEGIDVVLQSLATAAGHAGKNIDDDIAALKTEYKL